MIEYVWIVKGCSPNSPQECMAQVPTSIVKRTLHINADYMQTDLCMAAMGWSRLSSTIDIMCRHLTTFWRPSRFRVADVRDSLDWGIP
jgi:hypothetical protein